MADQQTRRIGAARRAGWFGGARGGEAQRGARLSQARSAQAASGAPTPRTGMTESAMGEAGLTPKAWFDEIAAYQGGESALPGVDRVLKLSSNENPLGPSSRAVEAYRRAADKLAVYPEGSARILREAVAAANGIDPDRIVCGAGSDELISLLCQVLCGPGDEVIHTEHAFAMYRIAAQATGATPVAVPETDITADPRAILKAVTPRTKIVFLANPNNPTGTYLPRQALTELVEDLPRSVLLVIDGAYAEYMRRPDYEAGFALAERAGNVAVTRTFSKIYGLAALRLGWVYAPAPLVEALNKARGPFNVSGPALAAGEAAVKDADYVQTCAIQNEVWRDWMIKELRDMGVSTPEGFANFVLPEFGAHGPASAAAVDGYLRAQGVIVRRLEGYGLPGHLRITVGSAADNVAVVQALRDFVEGGGGAMSRGGGAEPYS